MWRYLPFAIVIGVLAALVPPRGNDFFQFWYAGHLVATGQSPYDQSLWASAGSYGDLAQLVVRTCAVADAAECLWLYPPWTAWLFLPFGLLDPSVGVVAIAIFTLAALALGVVLAVHSFGRGLEPRWFALAAFTASAPVERAAISGHFLGLLLIGLVLVHESLRARRAVPFVAGALLLALKPHIVLVLPPLLVWHMVRTRTWRPLAIGSLALLALALVGFAADPRALPAIVGGTAAKISGVRENSSLLVQPTSGRVAGATLLLAVAAVATVVVLRTARPERRAASVVAAGAALSLAAAPYLHSYDDVLLIPGVIVAATVAGRIAGPAIVSAFLVASWVSYILELAGSPIAYSGILPAATLLALALAGAARARISLTYPP